MALSEEEIGGMEASWEAERTRLYRALLASFSAEQRALYDARWEATKWIERCRLWQRSMRRCHTPQQWSAIKPVWPDDQAQADWRMTRSVAE